MNDDRELLELAAKAAEIRLCRWLDDCGYLVDGDDIWNPLTIDSDAFRLAVKLELDVGINNPNAVCIDIARDDWVIEQKNNDPYAATRRAIVRAAAEIGKAMK